MVSRTLIVEFLLMFGPICNCFPLCHFFQPPLFNWYEQLYVLLLNALLKQTFANTHSTTCIWIILTFDLIRYIQNQRLKH